MPERMALARGWSNDAGHRGTLLHLWCPACDDLHSVEIEAEATRWTWDGNIDAPTIHPSILVSGVQWDADSPFHKPRHEGVAVGGRVVCHSFVKQGRWEYQGDCTHTLAGQVVAMVALPEWLLSEAP